MKTIKKGTKVKWRSHANGIFKTKKGTICAIVRAGAKPPKAVIGKLKTSGTPRKGVSYVVDVAGKFYWPRVGQLQTV